MSDFLGRLASRNLGTAESVRPRLPSLFEPYRTNGASGSWRDFGPAQEADATHAQNALSNTHSQDGGERDAEGARRSPDSTSAREPDGPLTRKSMRPNASSEPLHAARSSERMSPQRPWDAQRPALRVSRRQASTFADPGNATTSSAHRTHRDGNDTSDMAENAGGTIMPRIARSFLGGNQSAIPSFGSHSSPAWASRDASSRRSRAEEMQSAEKAAGSATVLRSVRQQLKSQAAPALSGSNGEAPVQVTIGRIEVRAVFPAAPVRQKEGAQTRTTVSLDDYLKRGREGKR